MRNLLTSLAILMLTLLSASPDANAQALDGTYTVTQGYTVTVQISAAYIRTLNQSTGISATWSTSNSSISIQSRTNTTCVVKGITPADKARLNYQCSYWIDGYYRTMNFYYEITVKSNVVNVTSVQVSPETTTLDIGDTYQLSAAVFPTNATNRTIKWSTENYSIASVSTAGLVTACRAGKTKIWAYSQDGSGCADYCIVTVNEPTMVESVELSETEKTLKIGDEFTLYATTLPSDAYNPGVTWASDNENVATVSDGVVTATGAGTCIITCTAADGSNVSATCTITVNEPEQYWLAVVLPNGMFAINVTGITPVKIKISPDNGYKIHSITLDGIEQPFDSPETNLSISKLEGNATINVVFVSESSNGIAINREDAPVHVTVCHNQVTVAGLLQNEIIYVYSQNGSLVKTTHDAIFELQNKGIYIMRIGSHSYKFAI